MREIEPTARERAWLRRLQKLVDCQPPNTWVFVEGGGGGATVNLMRLDEHGEKAIHGDPTGRGGGVSQTMIVGYVRTLNWDGGAW